MDKQGNVSHYKAVMADLQEKKSYHRAEIIGHEKAVADIDALIDGIQRHLGSTPKVSEKPNNVNNIDVEQRVESAGSLAGLSLRRAIQVVLYLSGHAMKSSEIAAKLQARGVTSAAQSFRGNVSATLSDMRNKREEVELGEGGWTLTNIAKDEVSNWLTGQRQDLLGEAGLIA
jgi:hypothetical protein